MRKLRVELDTVVPLSAALAIHSGKQDTSPSARVFFEVVAGGFVAVASTQTLYELADRLSIAKFQLPNSFVREFIELYSGAVELVAIRGLSMGCRDPHDDMFIETAYNGRVDLLVTRDLDLKDDVTRACLAERGCDVVGVREFLVRLRAYQALPENRV